MSVDDCTFCKIKDKKLPAKIRYEDEAVIAFDDINPKAPVHLLIVPKKHIPSVDALEPSDEKLVGQLIYTAQKIAREKGIAQSGYRLVFNTRQHAGQIVDHIHLHLLGGAALGPMA